MARRPPASCALFANTPQYFTADLLLILYAVWLRLTPFCRDCYPTQQTRTNETTEETFDAPIRSGLYATSI